MTKYLSKKLKWLSILMTLLVVAIHAFNFDYLLGGSNSFMNYIYFAPSIYLGRSAVPLFFLISGILFFKACDSFTFAIYKEKIVKRVKTVLIPYLCISAFFMLLVWLTHHDAVPYYLRIDHLLADTSLKNILLTWTLKPQAYYLWFLRNLFMLTLCSPIIYWLVKKGRWFFIIPTFGAWLLLGHFLPSAMLSFTFFALGGFISVKQISLPEKMNLPYLIGTIVIWPFFIYLGVSLKPHLDYSFTQAFINIYTFLGIVIAWLSYDYISPQFVEKVSKSLLTHYIFCIYLFHQIFLTLITQVWLYSTGNNQIESVLPMYYTSILLSIILSMLVAYALERLAPPLYRVITGSR